LSCRWQQRGTTISFPSHQISEVEQVADQVLMIDRGKLVLDASMDRIKEQYWQIQAVFNDPIEECDLRRPGIERVHVEGRTASFVASHNVDSIVLTMTSPRPIAVVGVGSPFEWTSSQTCVKRIVTINIIYLSYLRLSRVFFDETRRY